MKRPSRGSYCDLWLHRTVAVDDDERKRGVAAPIHRDAVLVDVVNAQAPRPAEQVEADRRLARDDLPIAAFGDRLRSTEHEAMMAWPRDDVDDAADGIGAVRG